MNYLLRVNTTWYAHIRIPQDLQAYFPSKVFKRSLHTSSKTQARKLLPPVLCDIQQTFFNLRLGNSYMPQDRPSQRAIEVFRLRYGSKTSPHEVAQPGEPCIFGTPWKFKDAVWKIQAKLDMGYDPEADGFFNLDAAPPQGLPATYQAPIVAVAPAVAPMIATTTLPAITLAEAKELYIAERTNPVRKLTTKPVTKETIAADELSIRRLVEFLKSDQILVSELPRDLYDFSVYLKNILKLKRDSVNKRIEKVGYFLEFLKRNNYITELPIIESIVRVEGEGEVDANIPFNNEQLNSIFNYLLDNIPFSISKRKNHLGLTYLLLGLIHTGFRISELEGCQLLRYNNVPIFDNKKKTKDNPLSIRYVPAHNRLIQSGFIDYYFNCERIEVRNLSNYFKKILIKLGIKVAGVNNDYTIHSCRSTFDTKSHGRITPDCLRKRLMGHASNDMDKRYVDQQPDDVVLYRAAVNKCVYEIDYGRISKYALSELKDLYPTTKQN